MSVATTFKIEQEEIVPFDLPWGSDESWTDIVARQGFRKDVNMELGRPHGGMRVEVHEAENPRNPYQEFAFLAVIRIGETPYPVFCRDLTELLACLQKVSPLIQLEMQSIAGQSVLTRSP